MLHSTVANLSILMGCAIALTVLLQIALKYRKQSALVAVIVFSVLLGFVPSALAMQQRAGSAIPNQDVPSKMRSDEGYEKNRNDTTMPPSGSQYQGLTYPDAKGTPLSDEAIESQIDAKVPDTIVYSVSNGSVRISGRVRDKGSAEKVVKVVQDIPGVHELAYDIEMTDVVSQ